MLSNHVPCPLRATLYAAVKSALFDVQDARRAYERAEAKKEQIHAAWLAVVEYDRAMNPPEGMGKPL